MTSLPTITQLIFGELAIPGLYMIWRAVQAVSVLRERRGIQGAVTAIGAVALGIYATNVRKKTLPGQSR